MDGNLSKIIYKTQTNLFDNKQKDDLFSKINVILKKKARIDNSQINEIIADVFGGNF